LKSSRSTKTGTKFRTEIPLLRPWLVKPEDLLPDFRAVWESGKLSRGEFTKRFEKLAARELGAKEAVAVSSCTSGLILVLRALGVKKKVVVPDYTFPATGHSALWVGAGLVFCDVDLDDFTLSPRALAKIDDPEVEAVLAVNIFGLPPKVGELEKICRTKGWKLIFDSAQGMGGEYKGRRCGGFGVAEVFSMSPSKLITSAEGGVITTNDPELAAKLVSLRDYGKGPNEDMAAVGLSARLSELLAVLAYKNLRHLKKLRAEREKLVKRYKKGLQDIEGIAFQEWNPDRKSGHNYFVFRVTGAAAKTRDELLQFLKEAGIEGKRYFYPALHQLTAYEGVPSGHFPAAEQLCREALAVPLYSGMSGKDQDLVVSRIREGLSGQ